jgi:hypothetical protein
MMTLVPPAYRFDTYDKIAALRAAIGNETKGEARHFAGNAEGFYAVELDESLFGAGVYIGVYGEHPEHGHIGIFWPQGTDNRDHGYWCVAGQC